MKNFPSAHIFPALLMVCALCYVPLRAQTVDSTKTDSVQKPRENWYWVHGGIGLGDSSYYTDIEDVKILGISVAVTDIIFTANYVVSTTTGGSDTVFPMTDISLLCGWIKRNDWSFYSISLGIASTAAYSINSRNTIGVVGELQASLKAFVPGFGVKLYGNLNPILPFICGTLTFHLGWMP